MKKLSFALACAVSVSLFADGLSNTIGFEDYAAGFTGLSLQTDAGGSGAATASYWLYKDAAGSTDGSTVKAYGSGDNLTAPTVGGDPGKNYLELSTEGGTLWRSVDTLADSTNLGEAQTIGSDGIYVDTLVQFTPTEDGGTPDTEAADKLAIWLNVDTSGAAPVTNLMVRANYYDGELAPSATNYVLSGAVVEAGTWYRLTVKAIADVCVANEDGYHIPAFAVYLDGNPLAATDTTIHSDAVNGFVEEGIVTEDMGDLIKANRIFPSLQQGESSSSTLQAVGFKGSGAIDNLGITDSNPLLTPVTDIEFTITTAGGVTAEWSTDGENWTVYAAGAKAAPGDLYIRLTNGDGVVKTLAKGTLSSESKAFDESEETFGWTEYLGDAVDGAYAIDDVTDLTMLQKGVASGLATAGVTFKQTADIDMSSTATAGWDGIGGKKGATPLFAGTYDGAGYTISNLTFARQTYRALFDSVDGATIKDLTVNVAGFISGTDEAGFAAVVGYVKNNPATLSNVTATGSIGSSTEYGLHSCGGIAVQFFGSMTACTNKMDIYAKSDNTKLGGMIGLANSGDSALTNCANEGKLVANIISGANAYVEGVGGLVGYNDHALTLKGCSNTGAVTDETNAGRAGQLVGYVHAALAGEGVNKGLSTGDYFGKKDDALTITGFELRYTADGVAEWYPAAQMYALVMAKADATTGVVPGTLYSYADKCTITDLAVDEISMTAGTITADEDSTATTESLTEELTAYLTGHKLVQTATTPNKIWTVDWFKYSGGAGTAEDPYRIARVKDLVELGEAVAAANTADQTAYYKQTADIALTGEWTGIGAFDAKDNLGSSDTYTAGAFQGIYDGGNYTISGLVLKRGDYVGFFGSTYGATIKNLKISLGSETGFGETSTSDDTMTNYGGAALVGVSVNTTIENCQTVKTVDYTTLKGTKAIGGIVGYAAKGTTVKGCVNNLNLETTNEKCGGMMSIAQNTGSWDFADVVIDSCTNNGSLYCSKSGLTRVGGLCSYSDIKVIFKGANVVTGTLSQNGGSAYSVASPNGGSVELAEGATFTVPAANMTIFSGKGVDGLFFATVADGVATLIKNADVAVGTTNKVMAAGAAPTIALTSGQWIAFDTSLAALGSTAGITGATSTNTVDSIVTYTAAAGDEWADVINGQIGEIPEADKVAVEEKLVQIRTALSTNGVTATTQDVSAWLTNVYGNSNVPAATIVAAKNVGVSVKYDLPLMTHATQTVEVVEAEVSGTDSVAAFSFAIKDGDESVSVQKAKIQNMVRWTDSLANPFAVSKSDQVEVSTEDGGKSFKAELKPVEGKTSGFMKVVLEP